MELRKQLMKQLKLVLDKEQACQVYAVVALSKKESEMIEFLKEKERTMGEIAKKMVELAK